MIGVANDGIFFKLYPIFVNDGVENFCCLVIFSGRSDFFCVLCVFVLLWLFAIYVIFRTPVF
jgi:hypothetical protein